MFQGRHKYDQFLRAQTERIQETNQQLHQSLDLKNFDQNPKDDYDYTDGFVVRDDVYQKEAAQIQRDDEQLQRDEEQIQRDEDEKVFRSQTFLKSLQNVVPSLHNSRVRNYQMEPPTEVLTEKKVMLVWWQSPERKYWASV